VSNTWVIDLRHYLASTGAMATDLPPRARLLAEYFASIVVDATTNFDDPPWVRCRRRPGHRRCTGLIQSFPAVGENDDEEAPIVWRCPVCGDDGLISGWQDSLWDGFSNPPAAS
jgi:hypothetical protein